MDHIFDLAHRIQSQRSTFHLEERRKCTRSNFDLRDLWDEIELRSVISNIWSNSKTWPF